MIYWGKTSSYKEKENAFEIEFTEETDSNEIFLND